MGRLLHEVAICPISALSEVDIAPLSGDDNCYLILFNVVMGTQLLTYSEVASRLNCCRQTVWKLVKRGEFPEPLRLGRSRRWLESDVDSWIAALAARSSAGGVAADTEAGSA